MEIENEKKISRLKLDNKKEQIKSSTVSPKNEHKLNKFVEQMSLMQQIKKKEDDNKKLEKALIQLSKRRKIIDEAIRQQKEDTAINRQRPNENIQENRENKDSKPFKLDDIIQKKDMLEAHKLLVDKSNMRILERIEKIKEARQREAVEEQERIVREQQLAINLLRKMQSNRRAIKKKKKEPRVKVKAMSPVESLKKRRKTKESLTLEPVDKNQVIQWEDLEKNAAILHKTDKAIAEKLRADAFDESQSSRDVPEEEQIAELLGLSNLAELLNNESDYDEYEEYFDYGESSISEIHQKSEIPIRENVQTNVRRLPGGRVSTQVRVPTNTI